MGADPLGMGVNFSN